MQFARENGWLLLTQRIAGAAVRRLRDGLIARRLKTSQMRIGRFPRLGGLAHIRLGPNFSAGDGLWLEAVTSYAGFDYSPSISIGANVTFSSHVHIACTNRVAIGDGVLSGSNVIITDHNHGIYAGSDQTPPGIPPNQRRLSTDKTVNIGSNVWLGDGVVVLGGADIGEGSIIGANSIVNGPIPPCCIAAGAPARAIRRWNPVTGQWDRWTQTP
jgi:lipopolysaccharide O-acetyltransferase